MIIIQDNGRLMLAAQKFVVIFLVAIKVNVLKLFQPQPNILNFKYSSKGLRYKKCKKDFIIQHKKIPLLKRVRLSSCKPS